MTPPHKIKRFITGGVFGARGFQHSSRVPERINNEYRGIMVLTFMMEGASLLSKTLHQGWVLVCPHWFQLVLALPFSTHLPFLLPALGFADCLPVSTTVCDQILPPVIFSSENQMMQKWFLYATVHYLYF